MIHVDPNLHPQSVILWSNLVAIFHQVCGATRQKWDNLFTPLSSCCRTSNSNFIDLSHRAVSQSVLRLCHEFTSQAQPNPDSRWSASRAITFGMFSPREWLIKVQAKSKVSVENLLEERRALWWDFAHKKTHFRTCLQKAVKLTTIRTRPPSKTLTKYDVMLHNDIILFYLVASRRKKNVARLKAKLTNDERLTHSLLAGRTITIVIILKRDKTLRRRHDNMLHRWLVH